MTPMHRRLETAHIADGRHDGRPAGMPYRGTRSGLRHRRELETALAVFDRIDALRRSAERVGTDRQRGRATAGLSSTSPRQWRKIVKQHRREAQPEIAARISRAVREGVRLDADCRPIRSWRDAGATEIHRQRMARRLDEKIGRGAGMAPPSSGPMLTPQMKQALRLARVHMTAREALAQAFSNRPKARARRR